MKKRVLITGIIIWISFIFFNSLQPGNASAASSGRIVTIFYDIFKWMGINVEFSVLSVWVRKLAHVFEYLVLTILVTILVFDSYIGIKYKTIYSLCSPLLVAIIDETIQTFIDGRAGMVEDVLIDSIGILIGFLFILLIKYIKSKKQLK